MLWRHYADQAALDEQFRLTGVSDVEAIMARRLALSAAARSSVRHIQKIPYGAGPSATLDLFFSPQPAGGGLAPVLMFIHGGFWKSLDAATFSFVGGAFAPAGALVAVIDYPLIPDVRMGDIVEHVGLAIRWLSENARAHGGDPGRLHIAGHSAGGQLAAIALDPAWQAACGIPPGAVRGGIAISGVFELEPLRRSFQQESLSLTEDDAAQWSPLRHIPASGAAMAPLVVAVAGAETQEFIDQSLELAAGWRDNGHAIDMHVVAGANHIDILTNALARPGAPLHEAVLRQMALSAPTAA
jgi:arylformamidase